jgi:hypothetical protein
MRECSGVTPFPRYLGPRINRIGADANPKPIEWNRRNLPGITFQLNKLEPPLSFADASFDLICALSVFTHIRLGLQKPWLRELTRLLGPAVLFLRRRTIS